MGGGRRLTPPKPKVSAETPGSGRLRLSEWTGRDGERRSRIQFVADAVQFLGAPKNGARPSDDGEKPDDQPALGAYRRKAS